MRRYKRALASAFLLTILPITGCQQEPSATGIEQIVLSRAVGPNQDPLGETDTFAPTSVVYCSVRFSTLPAGTVLTARWYYGDQIIENGTTRYTISQTEWSQAQEAIGYVTFRFEPRSPMPEGDYAVEISVNDQVFQRLPFQVRQP